MTGWDSMAMNCLKLMPYVAFNPARQSMRSLQAGKPAKVRLGAGFARSDRLWMPYFTAVARSRPTPLVSFMGACFSQMRLNRFLYCPDTSRYAMLALDTGLSLS